MRIIAMTGVVDSGPPAAGVAAAAVAVRFQDSPDAVFEETREITEGLNSSVSERVRVRGDISLPQQLLSLQ